MRLRVLLGCLSCCALLWAGLPLPTSGQSLSNIEGTPREIVVLNTGVALYAADVVESIPEGIARARDAIASGRAKQKLDQFVAVTQKLAGA